MSWRGRYQQELRRRKMSAIEEAPPTAGLAPKFSFDKSVSLSGDKTADKVMKMVMWAAALFLAAFLIGVIILLLFSGLPTFSWQFLTTSSNYSSGGGIGPILWVTLYTLVLSMIITFPVGVAAAVYLNEYAKPGRLTNFIRLSNE